MDGDIDIRFATINARFYIKKTNETDENTYHLVDTLGEVYNLPAFPAEFVLIDIAGTEYLSLNGDELIINSKKLKPLRDSYDDVKANVDASNIDPHLEIWKAKINGDKVLTMGTITATTDHVNLAVHPSGENTVAIGGKVWKKFVADSFPFTPVAAGETKMLIIFAMGDSQIFYLTEDYTLPDGALVVASITVSDSGVSVDDIAGYKPVGEDNWRTVQLDSTAAKIISMGITPASSFDIVPSAIGTKIGGIGSKMGMFLWDGKEFWFRNFSDFNVTLEPTSIEDTYNFKATTFAETYVLKKNSWAKFKIKEKKLILVEFGGSANFPEDAINGQVLEADSSANGGVKWGDKLKGVAANFLHYWNGTNWLSSGLKFVSGTINQLEFSGRIKADAVVLPANSNPNIANRLWSDGSDVWYDDSLGIPNKLAKERQIYKTIESNTTLDNNYHGAIVWITANVTITVNNSLRADFNCVFFVVGNFTGTITNAAGISIINPFGLVVYPNSTAMLHRYTSNQFILYM